MSPTDSKSSISRYWVLVGSGTLLLSLIIGYLLINLQQPERIEDSSVSLVEVVITAENLPAGRIIDDRWSIYTVQIPEEDVVDNVYHNREDVIGKVVRYELQPNDMITSDKLIDEISFDVLITTEPIAPGTFITEEKARIETIPVSKLGQTPMTGSNPLVGFDYFYLGDIRAVEAISAGHMISWENVSLEPLDDFQVIIEKASPNNLIEGPDQTEDLPTVNEVLDIVNFSLIEFILSFLIGVCLMLIFSKI